MTSLSRILPPLALAAVAVVGGACRKKPETAPTPVNTGPDTVAMRQAREDSIARAERARQDSIARAEQERRDAAARADADRQRMLADARNTLTAVVLFDFDRSDIRPDQQGTLDAKLPLLNANPGLRLRVSGNTDERGSDEYNMALGQRRAAAAKRYLTQHGIDASRVETVSRGEENPTCQGHDESCWSQNRRDEFEIIAGGDQLTLPNR